MIRQSLACAILLVGCSAPCLAETLTFHATLQPQAEVPSANAKGSGEATAVLDTTSHVLTYDVTFQGFASKVTMAHFHGPASPTANAGVQVPLGNDPTSPIHGTATLTPEQQKQLISGLWYANVHTANHPKGAARGQMLQAK